MCPILLVFPYGFIYIYANQCVSYSKHNENVDKYIINNESNLEEIPSTKSTQGLSLLL